MLTGTSTFITSTPYWSFVNSAMDWITISGFFRANSSLFLGEQQSCLLGASARSRQTPFRIQQDGAGMGCEDFANDGLEFFHHRIGNLAAFFLGQGFLQGAALVHGGRCDHAPGVRNGLH